LASFGGVFVEEPRLSVHGGGEEEDGLAAKELGEEIELSVEVEGGHGAFFGHPDVSVESYTHTHTATSL